MSCYIISYDLNKNKDYGSLYSAIKSYGNWAHINESVWAVVTDKTAVAIRDHLLETIDNDDQIFVVKSGTDAAWRKTICNSDWLKKIYNIRRSNLLISI